jgi:hypothetical protein
MTDNTPNKGSVQELKIISNYSGKDLNLTDGFLELILYESILSYTVFAEMSFVDTGHRQTQNGTATMEGDDINLVSNEKIELKVTDANNQIINCKGNNHLRINTIKSVDETVNKSIISLDLHSKERIDNELVETRLTNRYDGKISDSVFNILRNALRTPKTIDIDQTLNEFNFIGHLEKPFHKIPWLAKRSVPDMPNAKGNLAGYFFYETFDDGSGTGGYKFKSIDKLWSQTPKRKLIYNDLISIPTGYSGKILAYSFDSNLSVDRALKSGALSSSVIKTFDPRTNNYKEDTFTDKDRLKPANIGGLETPKLGIDGATRISSRVRDTGVLPLGSNLKSQLNSADQQNFNMEEIIRQSYTRYNNLFTVKLSITIYADFGIHVGDIIECDFPEVSGKDKTIVSNKKSGRYMVIDLAHRVHSTGFYSVLNLARESIRKK